MLALDLREPGFADYARAVTLGTFDGVHIGHQALIRQTLARARELELRPLIATFWPIPKRVLGNGTVKALNLLDEKLALLKAFNCDVVVIRFDKKLALKEAKDFLEEMLIKEFHARLLSAGAPFRFGHESAGDVQLLRQKMVELGGETLVLQRVEIEGEPVSSTRIRKVVSQGDMTLAKRLLGRPYMLQGKVVPGLQQGNGLGYPTANLEIDEAKLLPARGVYVGRASVEGLFEQQPALCNVGPRPTVVAHAGKEGVEVHVFEFAGQLYGRTLQFECLDFLRPQKKFETTNALAKQIGQDRLQALKLLEAKA